MLLCGLLHAACPSSSQGADRSLALLWLGEEGECEGVCGAVAELEARVYSSPRDALRAPGSLVRNAAVPTPSDPCLMS